MATSESPPFSVMKRAARKEIADVRYMATMVDRILRAVDADVEFVANFLVIYAGAYVRGRGLVTFELLQPTEEWKGACSECAMAILREGEQEKYPHLGPWCSQVRAYYEKMAPPETPQHTETAVPQGTP